MSAFWTVDFAPILAALLASLAAALVGNILVLTRQAMAADALSHAIVPGVVLAVVVAGAATGWAMMAGGLAAALAATGCVAFLTRVARVEPGAALGVTFTAFFAAGILALEWTGLARTAFDVHHVVAGHLEGLVWIHEGEGFPLFDGAALAALPPALGLLAMALVLVAAIVAGLAKELAAAAFDPVFAEASGVPVGLTRLALLAATAIACLAAFQTVGVVLAAAMIVCPPATARLMTRRLPAQVAVSLALAAAAVLIGYGLAVLGPKAFGFDLALGAAGTIGAVAGLMLAVAAAVSPLARR